jgi:hypothetical protein
MDNPSMWEVINNTAAWYVDNVGVVPVGRGLWSSGSNGWVFSKPVAFDPSKVYRLGIHARKQLVGHNKTVYLACRFLDHNGALLDSVAYPAGWPAGGLFHYFGLIGQVPPDGFTEYSITFGPGMTAQIPPGARFISAGALLGFSGATGEAQMAGVTLRQVIPTEQIVPGAATKLFTHDVSFFKGGSGTTITDSYAPPNTAMTTLCDFAYTPPVDCQIVVNVDALLRNNYSFIGAGVTVSATSAIGIQVAAVPSTVWDTATVSVRSDSATQGVGGPMNIENQHHAVEEFSALAGVPIRIVVGAGKAGGAVNATQRRVKVVVQAILR